MVAREGYTILDYLSDIGGMQGMICSGFAFLLSAWNYNYFDDFMVSNLYKLDRINYRTEVDVLADVGRYEKMRPRFLDNPRACVRDIIPTCVYKTCCCKLDRRTRAFAIARSKLSKEANAFDFIRQKRFVNQAIKTLLSKA